jgi:glyoxylate/hydroxypyruvate reductase A
MKVLLVHGGRDTTRWCDLLRAALPDVDVVTLDDGRDPSTITWVAGWNFPPGLFATLPQLQAVFAFAAGVDAFLARDDLSPAVPLVRLADAGMAAQMAEYALYGVLTWQRDLHVYALQQPDARWKRYPPRARADVRVAVLGIGAIGSVVATTLAQFGYAVSGWSRSPRALAGVRCVHGDAALLPLLACTDVLVNVLPSTPLTRGRLDREHLGALPSGAYVINCARGDQLDAGALLALLDDGHLGGALLDVFTTEPLPADDPLWRHPRVRVTPHISAITLLEPSARQIADNIERLQRGEAMIGVVERRRGY